MKKLRKRDKYVIAAVLNLCWYCIAVLVLTAHDKVVPDSLTVAWFAAWTAELGLLAGIKIKGKDAKTPVNTSVTMLLTLIRFASLL